MGFDIFAFPERRVNGQYETDERERFFGWRHREMWAFLGGWDSEIGIPPIAEARGVPAEGLRFEPFISEGLLGDMFGMSWLSVRELLDFDYEATFIGRFRVTEVDEEGHIIYVADPNARTEITFRRFLGPDYFHELARLASSGAERIVFFYA